MCHLQWNIREQKKQNKTRTNPHLDTDNTKSSEDQKIIKCTKYKWKVKWDFKSYAIVFMHTLQSFSIQIIFKTVSYHYSCCLIFVCVNVSCIFESHMLPLVYWSQWRCGSLPRCLGPRTKVKTKWDTWSPSAHIWHRFEFCTAGWCIAVLQAQV